MDGSWFVCTVCCQDNCCGWCFFSGFHWPHGFCPVRPILSFVSGIVHLKMAGGGGRKKQYQRQMMWYWCFAHCVNILLSFWRYVQMYFYSMVCVNMSQFEPKPTRKGDIICKVTMYPQLTSTISILYIWLEPGIRSYIKHGNRGTSSPDWVSHLFGFSWNVHPWRLPPCNTVRFKTQHKRFDL